VTAAVTVLKFGGELLEGPEALLRAAAAVAATANGGPLVVVHGGGKAIDAALRAAGIETHQVDGLRITDEATLEVVVSVLAGSINTHFVAALVSAGVAAVGLTGADAGCGLSELAPPHRAVDGRLVDLGRVGLPSAEADVRVLRVLTSGGFVPVVACVGATRAGRLLNVNADTLAGHLAALLGARRLVIAGTTPGVLTAGGATVPAMDRSDIARAVADGTATAGMIAKLRACDEALAAGVDEVVVVDGRDPAAIPAAAVAAEPAAATRLVANGKPALKH
jgi:acetylglutamate kinase